MKLYFVAYRIEGSRWMAIGTIRARSPAGAITQVARSLSDIEGVLEISACEA